MRQRLRRLTALLLLAALLAGCSAASPAAQNTAAPAASAPSAPPAPVQTPDSAEKAAESGGKEIPPTPPSTMPDKSGYYEYARLFYRELEKGDAFEASSFIWFENEEDRAAWLDRFAAPYNARLASVSAVSRNLWAVTVEEELGKDAPATQTVYYVAYYDGSYRIFTDPHTLPKDLLRDQDYSGMPVSAPEKTGGGKTPDGGDEFPPEDGQREKWYREQQAELAAVKAAADKAVRALPEAKTVTSFDDPKIELVDAKTVDFLKIEPKGSKLLLYKVSYPTTADAILGPIVLYLDSEANVLGVAPRD